MFLLILLLNIIWDVVATLQTHYISKQRPIVSAICSGLNTVCWYGSVIIIVDSYGKRLEYVAILTLCCMLATGLTVSYCKKRGK